jgi:hypothetical protein
MSNPVNNKKMSSTHQTSMKKGLNTHTEMTRDSTNNSRMRLVGTKINSLAVQKRSSAQSLPRA